MSDFVRRFFASSDEEEVVAPVPPPGELLLGRYLEGDAGALPLRSGSVCWSVAELRRHVVVLGSSGSGKTETALRLAYEVASRTEDQVFFLDAKGSRSTAERFVGLMEEAGRSPRVFPNEPIDGWRGDWRGVSNRLLEMITYAAEGPASYYRDIAKLAIQLACRFPEGPPRSSGELLARLDFTALVIAHPGSSALNALDAGKVDQVRMRYEAFFGQLGLALDGNWAFDDVDSAYLLLDSVSLGEDARGSAAMLFSDFAHYFKERKPSGRGCLMAIDELSGIAGSVDLAMRVEQAREFGVGFMLMPQSIEGMGGIEQARRIIGAVRAVVAHGSSEPDAVAALAGNRRVLGIMHRVSETSEPAGSSFSEEEVPRLHADEVRRLEKGQAWVIVGGEAVKVAVERAPQVSGSLPIAEDLYPVADDGPVSDEGDGPVSTEPDLPF
jgi:hypothetical protein